MSPVIRSRFSSKFAIFAIHGGVETETSKIAEALAGDDLSLYIFKGSGGSLHIPSQVFNEPRAIELTSKVDTIISIHGQHDDTSAFVMIGGLDTELKRKIEDALRQAGFTIAEPPEQLDGDNPRNICNRGRSGKGVQLEISEALRRKLHEDIGLLRRFSDAVRQALLHPSK